MMREYKTALEILGRQYPLTVSYECAPGDGWPIIHEALLDVEEERYEEGNGLVKTITVYIVTKWLDEKQLAALKSEIDCALKEAAIENRIERWAIEKEDFLWSAA